MISLDVAKQLKAVGWKRNLKKGSFAYAPTELLNGDLTYSDRPYLIDLHGDEHKDKCGYKGKCECECNYCYPYAGIDLLHAPNCEELLDVLPDMTELHKSMDKYVSAYNEMDGVRRVTRFVKKSTNPADALGLLLVALIKEGIVKV